MNATVTVLKKLLAWVKHVEDTMRALEDHSPAVMMVLNVDQIFAVK